MMKAFTFFLVAMLSSTAIAVDDERDAEREEVRAVSEWAQSVVSRLQFENTQTGQQLKSHPGSLLRWSNPIIGKVYGDSFLWLDEGRPAAFLSVYAVYDLPEGNRRLTFQSLSEQTLQATLDDVVVWNPSQPGLQFQRLEDFPAPGANPRLQRIRHRRIAQLFTGQIAEKSDPDRFRNLRLLTAPLLQYQNDSTGVETGSLYALADGTDPELLLLIETCVSDGKRHWRFAPIRQNHRHLKLIRNESIVWEAPALAPPFPNPKISDPAGVYFNTQWEKLSAETTSVK